MSHLEKFQKLFLNNISSFPTIWFSFKAIDKILQVLFYQHQQQEKNLTPSNKASAEDDDVDDDNDEMNK